MRARLGEHRLDEIRSWPEYLHEGSIFFVHNSPSDRLRKERGHDPGFPPERQEILYHAPGGCASRSAPTRETVQKWRRQARNAMTRRVSRMAITKIAVV